MAVPPVKSLRPADADGLAPGLASDVPADADGLAPGLASDVPSGDGVADGASEAASPPLSAGPVVPAGPLQAATIKPMSRVSQTARGGARRTCRARGARPTLGPAGVSVPHPRDAVGGTGASVGPRTGERGPARHAPWARRDGGTCGCLRGRRDGSKRMRARLPVYDSRPGPVLKLSVVAPDGDVAIVGQS